MKKYLFVFSLSMLICHVHGQTSLSPKDSAKLARLEQQVLRSEAKLTTANQKLAYADSLMQVGRKMISEGKVADKALEADGRLLDKTYANNRKPLTKRVKSKNKLEVKKAKAELKQLDNGYKADTKVFLNDKKAVIKEISNGKINYAKGKAYKKNANVDIKKANKAVATAQKAYDTQRVAIETKE